MELESVALIRSFASAYGAASLDVSVFSCGMRSPKACYGWLRLDIRCGQNLAARGRHLRQRHRRSRFLRLGLRFWMKNRILEPVGEIRSVAALSFRRRRLAFAFGGAGGAFDTDMEVIMVTIHRPYLGEPAAIALGFPAQRFFDCRVDENQLHAPLLRGVSDQREMI